VPEPMDRSLRTVSMTFFLPTDQGRNGVRPLGARCFHLVLDVRLRSW